MFYILPCKVCTVHCKLSSVHCTEYMVHCQLWLVHYTRLVQFPSPRYSVSYDKVWHVSLHTTQVWLYKTIQVSLHTTQVWQLHHTSLAVQYTSVAVHYTSLAATLYRSRYIALQCTCIIVHYIRFGLLELEDTARYTGLPLAPAEGFGLWPRFFYCASGKKRAYNAVLSNFWKILVSSSNLGSF